MVPDLDRLQALVRRAADEELTPRFGRIGAERKADGSLLTEADLAMDARLRRELAEAWPGIGFLSEEMPPEAQAEALAESQDGLWILDPLDGTSNFANGVSFWSVSLGLIRDGEPLLGLVYDPQRGECFDARRGSGARLNAAPLVARTTGTTLDRALAVVDLKRLEPGLRARIATELPFASQRNFGSCALEWAWMAAGRGHVYLHGGMGLWDLAAGCLILQEAGGRSCTLQGEPVFLPRVEKRSVIAAGDPAVFDAWRNWLGA
jgi:myo-inositol-1(or 4)-monophosphatase